MLDFVQTKGTVSQERSRRLDSTTTTTMPQRFSSATNLEFQVKKMKKSVKMSKIWWNSHFFFKKKLKIRRFLIFQKIVKFLFEPKNRKNFDKRKWFWKQKTWKITKNEWKWWNLEQKNAENVIFAIFELLEKEKIMIFCEDSFCQFRVRLDPIFIKISRFDALQQEKLVTKVILISISWTRLW